MLGFNAQNMHIYLVRLYTLILGRTVHRFELLILGSVMYNLQCVSYYIINWHIGEFMTNLYKDLKGKMCSTCHVISGLVVCC
jgi:hypothetical protein